MNHTRLLDYANGRYTDRTGNFNVTSKYTPQRSYNLGLKASFLIIFGLAMHVLVVENYARKSFRMAKVLRNKVLALFLQRERTHVWRGLLFRFLWNKTHGDGVDAMSNILFCEPFSNENMA
jgi:hypothetical protein